jgi:hypothetical protein
MQYEVLLKAIGISTMGVAIIAVLLLLLISIRKEVNGGEPIRGLVPFGFLVMGLCAFMGLMAALYSANRAAIPAKISHKLDAALLAAPWGDAQ